LSRRLIELSSLCHPLLFRRFAASERSLPDLRACRLAIRPEAELEPATLRYYLQSLLFLAGCTLTPAIVQGRFSVGTVDSKLMRLWQAAHYARRFNLPHLRSLNLERFVRGCATSEWSSIESLVAIKRAYGQALSALVDGLAFTRHTLSAARLTAAQRERFGFLGSLRAELGSDLRCVIAYGSSVTSGVFADYDLFLVVRDPDRALRSLAGRAPSFGGKELNLSLYGAGDFLPFQLTSGDNLNEAALCLYGEAEVPIKPVPDLLVRNISFGFIRLRQLLGLCGSLAGKSVRAVESRDFSLYEYFMKIPMHVAKGTRSAQREPVAKEVINEWTKRELGYDLERQLALVRTGRLAEATAAAYCATEDVLAHLNRRYGIFELVPAAAVTAEGSSHLAGGTGR